MQGRLNTQTRGTLRIFFWKSYNVTNVTIFQSEVKNVEDNYKMEWQFDINILYDAPESLGAVIT